MSDVNEFKDKLKKELYKYCPNDECLDGICSYIEVLYSGRDVMDFERSTFEANMRNMIVFSAHDIIQHVLNGVYRVFRNTTELNERGSSIQKSEVREHKEARRSIRQSNTRKSGFVLHKDNNSISFDDMDLDAIPKSDSVEEIKARVSISKSTDNSVVNTDEDDDIDRFTTDASSTTSEEFNSEPKFSFDLEY